MNTASIVLCAIIKTIGVIVAFVSFIAFLALVAVNITPQTIIDFLAGVFLIFLITFVVGNLFMKMYRSCEESNQQTAKKTTPVQSNTEPVTYSTHSKQKTTSEQCDVKPTKQYTVLDEIQKIISHLSELEKNQDLDKELFVEFHVLKDKFNSDHQEIVKMLNTLGEINQFDDNHYLDAFKKQQPFNHYLHMFQKQQQIIYDNIKQQYTNKLNTINEQLQHFN